MSDVKKFIEDMKDDNISIFGSMLKPLTRNNCETIIPMLKDHPDPRRRAVVVDMGKPNVIYVKAHGTCFQVKVPTSPELPAEKLLTPARQF